VKRATVLIASLLVCATAATAIADQGHIAIPQGWSREDGQAKSLTEKTNALKHFGGAKSMASAEVYVAPAGYAAGLYVTTVAAAVKDNREAAARAEIDSFLASPQRAQLTSPKIVVDKSVSQVDPTKKQIEAIVAWTDKESGLSSTSRLLVVADADYVIAVSAECSHGEQPGAHVDACLAALDTLDPGVAVDKRVAVALAPAGTEPPPPTMSSAAPSATMSDGGRTPLPPMVVSSTPQRTVDRRPVYVGLGIIVLAALFWWNRRRRERLEVTDKDNDGR
jgi:hypothetical protein